jgi:cytochrome P450
VARHANVLEVLHRDLDFLIAPINEKRIVEVNGPFVLGMDRSATLVRERGALYQALAAVDLPAIRSNVQSEAATLVSQAGKEIDVVEAYARPIAAHTATALFGISGTDPQTFMDVARAVFGHVFLNLKGDETIRQRGIRAGKLMEGWFNDEIARRRASGQLGTDMMGALLAAGAVDDDGVRRTLGGMLVGSIDTTATSVAKIVTMIAKDRELAQRVAADVNDETRLAGWCSEALRRWPHNPIVLRHAAKDQTRRQDFRVDAGRDARHRGFSRSAIPAPGPPLGRLPAFRRRAAPLRRPCRQCVPDSRAGRRSGAARDQIHRQDRMGRTVPRASSAAI